MSTFESRDHELRVSVVIPAFNAGTTLPATVQSLLDQTRTDWEGGDRR